MRTSSRLFASFAFVAAAISTLIVAIPAHAQSESPNEVIVELTPADRNAALAASMGTPHVRPANTAVGQALRARQISATRVANQTLLSDGSGGGRAAGTILQYTGDLSSGGGKVVTSAVSHAVYLQRQPGGNCPIATCWGDPEGFLRDLGNSDFIHVIDQYIGLTGANRYTVGFHAIVNYTPPVGPFTDSLAAVVHAVAAKTGATGYGHIYHIFMPPGQDECYALSANYCYSPDNPATFAYCAYHNHVDFDDIGHVIYTVEPYQNVPGCQVQPGTPNGTLVDSTDDTLSHETFETITDPDLDGWRNGFAYPIADDIPFDLAGAEIADECEFFVTLEGQGYGNVPTFLVGAHRHSVQLIYSNRQHACSSAPLGGSR